MNPKSSTLKESGVFRCLNWFVQTLISVSGALEEMEQSFWSTGDLF